MEVVDRQVPDSPPAWPWKFFNCCATKKYIYVIQCCKCHNFGNAPCKLLVYRYNMLSHVWKKLSISEGYQYPPSTQQNKCAQVIWKGTHILSVYNSPNSRLAALIPLSGPDRGKVLPLEIRDILPITFGIQTPGYLYQDPANRNKVYVLFYVGECCFPRHVGLARISIDEERREFRWNCMQITDPSPLVVTGVCHRLTALGSSMYLAHSYCRTHDQGQKEPKLIYVLDMVRNTWRSVEALPNDAGNWPPTDLKSIGGISGSASSPDRLFAICNQTASIWCLDLSSRKWSQFCADNYLQGAHGRDYLAKFRRSGWMGIMNTGELYCFGYYYDVPGYFFNGTREVMKMTRRWMKPPTLKRLTMERLLAEQPQLVTTPANDLRVHGVPPDMIDLLVEQNEPQPEDNSFSEKLIYSLVLIAILYKVLTF